jgi:hypothetical protein
MVVNRGSELSPFAEAQQVALVRTRLVVPAPVSAQPTAYSIQVLVDRAVVPQDCGKAINDMINKAGTALDAKFVDALAAYTAQEIVHPAWTPLDSRWITVDPANLDAAAGAIDDFKTGIHQVTLGRSAGLAADAVGLPGPAAALAGGVIAEIPLPIDRTLNVTERSICMMGIVVGLATGLHPLACASMKRLAHDMLISTIETGLKQLAPDLGNRPVRPPDAPAGALASRGGRPLPTTSASQSNDAANELLIRLAKNSSPTDGPGSLGPSISPLD